MSRSSNLYPYPSAWGAPYAIKYRMHDCYSGARMWRLVTGVAVGLNLAYCIAYFWAALSSTEFSVFLAITSVGAIGAMTKSWQLRTQAIRLDEARAICNEMERAPYAWREFALSRKAYEYAQSDDVLRLALAKLVLATGALSISALGLGSLMGMPISAALWFGACIFVLGGIMGSWRVTQRQRSRQRLYHVLGPRETRSVPHLEKEAA